MPTPQYQEHTGFSSPFDFIKVKPNFIYASSFVIFHYVFEGIINLEEIDKNK